MPAKQKKERGRGRVAATPDIQPTESVYAPVASDEESSGASTDSETVAFSEMFHKLFIHSVLVSL